RLLQRCRQVLAAAVLLHPLPEMDAVVMLGSLVEERLVLAVGRKDDLFDGLATEPGFSSELVAHVDIGLVVLVVVIVKRLLGHEGLESLIVVGQFRQFKSHYKISLAEK